MENLGPADIEIGTLEVEWPIRTANGEHLLYIMEVDITNGYQCDVIGDSINPENFTVMFFSLALFYLQLINNHNFTDSQSPKSGWSG